MFDTTKPPNAWLVTHIKNNKNNVKNTIKFMFCSKYINKSNVNSVYKDAMESIKSIIRISYMGVIKVRNKFNSGIIFTDSNMPTVMSVRMNLNPVKAKYQRVSTHATKVTPLFVGLKWNSTDAGQDIFICE